MKTLTVFTPTYNRAHTLVRTYESLCRQTCNDFEWLIIDDGSTDNTEEIVKSWLREQKIPVRYIKKENGGLHTGYTTAFANIDSELNVCIDSDDYMPENAVEIIVKTWNERGRGHDEIAGVIGLDYVMGGDALGGFFTTTKNARYCEITTWHAGDIKIVCRTDIFKKLPSMPIFKGEKNFNPTYYYKQVDLKHSFIIINENLCWVDYQADGMSSQIFYQYRNSPNSFAQFRRLSMTMPFYTRTYRWKNVIHYVSSCIFARQWNMVKTSPYPWATIAAFIPGLLLNLYVRYKTPNFKKK